MCPFTKSGRVRARRNPQAERLDLRPFAGFGLETEDFEAGTFDDVSKEVGGPEGEAPTGESVIGELAVVQVAPEHHQIDEGIVGQGRGAGRPRPAARPGGPGVRRTSMPTPHPATARRNGRALQIGLHPEGIDGAARDEDRAWPARRPTPTTAPRAEIICVPTRAATEIDDDVRSARWHARPFPKRAAWSVVPGRALRLPLVRPLLVDRRGWGRSRGTQSRRSCSLRRARSTNGSHTMPPRGPAVRTSIKSIEIARLAPFSSRSPMLPSRSRRITEACFQCSSVERRKRTVSPRRRPMATRSRVVTRHENMSLNRACSRRIPASHRSRSSTLRRSYSATSGWGRIKNRSAPKPLRSRRRRPPRESTCRRPRLRRRPRSPQSCPCRPPAGTAPTRRCLDRRR